MSDFWKRWFVGWSLFVALFGFVLVGAGVPALDSAAEAIFALIGARDLAWTQQLRFSVALMGAVTCGWGLTLLAATRAAAALGAQGRPIWRGLLGAMLVWWALDGLMSVATGFWLNAVSNTLILAGFIIGIVGSGALRGRAAA